MKQEDREAIDKILSGLANGSPYRPFGYPKKDLRNVHDSKDYRCPNCGKYPPDSDDMVYEVDGEKYPQCYNEYLSSNMDGTTHDWDEVHKCPYCKTMFKYRNGCF